MERSDSCLKFIYCPHVGQSALLICILVLIECFFTQICLPKRERLVCVYIYFMNIILFFTSYIQVY